MMKTYHLYVFTQENCQPCKRLKDYVSTLPKGHQQELDFVPLRVKSKMQPYPVGHYTALADDLNVTQSPTLVVVHEELSCVLDADGDDYCDGIEVPVERFVGANNIIEHLPATLMAYTYVDDE